MRRLISITALAAVAVMAFVPAASAAKTHTALTTDGVFYVPTPATLFTGDVISVKKACANKRVVTIFRKRSGADEKIGTTKSKPGLTQKNLFFWSLEKPGLLPKGTYYSIVEATDKCAGARSKGYVGPG
jgi:hypothetical protein